MLEHCRRHGDQRPNAYERKAPARAGNDCPRGPMKKWQCIVCGWIYDEAEGCEYEDIPPGTAWEDVPDDFVCPECGVGKEDFEMIEVG